MQSPGHSIIFFFYLCVIIFLLPAKSKCPGGKDLSGLASSTCSLHVNKFYIFVLHCVENIVKVIFDEQKSSWKTVFLSKNGLMAVWGEGGKERDE